jgi:hypothetical protein
MTRGFVAWLAVAVMSVRTGVRDVREAARGAFLFSGVSHVTTMSRMCVSACPGERQESAHPFPETGICRHSAQRVESPG